MSSRLSKTEQEKPPLEDWRTEYAQRLRGEIAADWCVKNVGDICSIRTGKIDVNQADEDGAYPFFTCAEKVYRINTPAFDTEAVLLAGNGDFNVKYYKGKFNAYQRTYVLSDLQVDGKYLYYYISYRLRDLTGDSRGSTIKYIRLGDVRDYPVPVAPLDQQKRIVAEIEKQFSRLDEAVANLKRVKANLKRYKAAVLKAAVEGRLVETEAELARRAAQGSANVAGGMMPGATEGRSYETGAQLLQRILETRRSQWKGKGKYKEPAAPDTTDLPELPEGWVWASAEQISDFITKGTTPAATKLSPGAGEVQFLKVYNLTFDGSLNYNYKPAFVSRKTHEGELARSKVVAGDVLINIVGPPLGQVSVVPTTLPEANINQAIARFRPIKPLNSGFLSLTLLTEEIMRWAMSRAKTTAGQSNLTLELCRALPIPLPPIAEHARIVSEVDRRLSLVHEVESQVDANLKRAEHLRQTVLRSAFSGRLFSSVDTNLKVAV